MARMSDTQEEHLESIKDEMEDRFDWKYRKGQEEHKTDLRHDHSIGQVLEFSMEEVTDLPVYLITLKQRLEDLVDILFEPDDPAKACEEALKLIGDL